MRAILTIMAGVVAAVAAAPIGAQQPGEGDEGDVGVAVERDVMVTMRDGTRLATDIYRPTVNGVPTSERLPVLLHRTPYVKDDDGLTGDAEYFVDQGYVVVVQNLRGRYKSEGGFRKYDEIGPRDAYDTIEWLATLPYTNGEVGMWGTSYGAHTQAEAAIANPPGLKTVLLNFGGPSNLWDNAVRHGGAFELGRELTWAWGQIEDETDDPVVKEHMEAQSVQDWYAALPFRKGLSPLAIAPEFEEYFLNEMTRTDYDDFWKTPSVNWSEHYEQTADIPMMHVGGWYDIWLRTTTDNYVNLARLKSSPVHMLIGPWTHGGNDETYAGNVDFGPDAAIEDFGDEFHRRWFDHYLKGESTGAEDLPPVRIFVMGTGDGHKTADGRLFHGGYWQDASAWPLPEARETRYYFHQDGSLSTEAPASGAPSTTYTYDPNDPVPTIGGNVSGRLDDGAYDQREGAEVFGSKPPFLPLRARQDVVVFQTEPLEEDVTIAGPVMVRLFASSTAVDTDFTAKLVDVYPPSADFPTGYDMNLADGVIRGRYRGGRTTQELMEPGEVYEFEIRPFPTANVFKKGHRIRVDISSSNFPRFDVNPNTGEPLGQNRLMMKADNTIYHDASRASHVVLSLVPNRQ